MSPTKLLAESSLPWETVTSMLRASRYNLSVGACAESHRHAYEAAQQVDQGHTHAVAEILALRSCEGCPNVDLCPLHNDSLQP